MNRQLFNDLEQYFLKKKRPTSVEKNLLSQLQKEKPHFAIAYIDRDTVVQNGYVGSDLGDFDMEELAGMVGDCVCGSQQYDYAIEQACKGMGLDIIPLCPKCGADSTFDRESQTYTCDSCGQNWADTYTLVEDPEETDRLPDELGYPSCDAQNSNARYIPEFDYLQIFKKKPEQNSYFEPVSWPKSQKYMPNEDAEPAGDSIDALPELINDEKGIEDFGVGAVWVPLCNL